MTKTWKQTVEPRIAQAYAEYMEDENARRDEEYQASRSGLPFSFSGVMGCARALGYRAAAVAPSNPMDGASLAVTGLGQEGHEKVQAAVKARWPNATVEGRGQIGDLIGGLYDIDDPDHDELVEIKFVGAFKFDMSIGLFRSARPPKLGPPKGPSLAHVCQGGFNAYAHGRSKVRIVYISREAVSVQKAALLDMGSVERFAAEWVIERDVWQPLVTAELVRLETIRGIVDKGEIPDRADLDDQGKPLKVNIATHWRCPYCPYQDRCKADGPGRPLRGES